jgi:hypothetical protein
MNRYSWRSARTFRRARARAARARQRMRQFLQEPDRPNLDDAA